MISVVAAMINKHPLLVHALFCILGLGVSSFVAYWSYLCRSRMHVFRFTLMELCCANVSAFIFAFFIFKFKHLNIPASMAVWSGSFIVSSAYFFYCFNSMKISYNRRYNRYVFHFSRYQLYYRVVYPLVVSICVINLLGLHAQLYTLIGLLSALVRGIYCAIPMSFLLVFFFQVQRHHASS